MDLPGFHDISLILKVGVYALVHRGEVVYIGKSKNMLTRIYSHKQLWSARRGKQKLSFIPIKGVLFDEVHIQTCTLEEIDALEQRLIKQFKPKFNVKHRGEPPVRNIGAIKLKINGAVMVLGSTPKPSGFVRRV